MQAFKLSPSLAVVLLLLTSACNLPKPQDRPLESDKTSANFVITEIKGDSPNDNMGADFKVQSTRKFSFSVCLKDNARFKEVAGGQKFILDDLNKEVKTDAKGCLNWTEDIAFNYFSEPQYLQWVRKISGSRPYQGTRTANFAINPWNMVDKTPAVLNLETTSPSNLVTGPQAVAKVLTSKGTDSSALASWFTLAPLEFKFIRVAKETTSSRQISYSTKACIKSSATTKNLRNYKFLIKRKFEALDAPEKTFEVYPDSASCLNWDDQIEFKYYDCQKYFRSKLVIENKELSVNQSVDMVINPWDSSSITFARDLRYFDPETSFSPNCKNENSLESSLLLTNYGYTTLSYRYDIDNFLNLTFKKKLRFKADARVLAFSDVTKGRMDGAQKLRPGVYLLKLALIKNKDYYNQRTFIASAEKLISILDGEVRADVEFSTVDLKGVGNRNTLLVELNPVSETLVQQDKDGNITAKNAIQNFDELIDRSSKLKINTFSGAMTLSLDHDNQELSIINAASVQEHLLAAPRTDNKEKIETTVVRDYINFGKTVELEQKAALVNQSSIEAFATRNNLSRLSATTGPEKSLAHPPPLAPSDISSIATTGRLSGKIEETLCSYWYRNILFDDINPAYKIGAVMSRAIATCLSNGRSKNSMFKVEKKLFIKELQNHQFVKGYNQSLVVNNSMTMSHTKSSSRTFTRGYTLGLGLTQRFADVFSIGISSNFSLSYASSDQAANASATGVTANSSLVVQENIFELTFKRYEECSVVKIHPRNFLSEFLPGLLKKDLSAEQLANLSSKGLLFCNGVINETPISRYEHYYLLAQDNSNSQLQDVGDSRNRNFFIAVRGQKEYERLLFFMKSGLKKPGTLQSEETDLAGKESLTRLFETGLPTSPASFNDAQ